MSSEPRPNPITDVFNEKDWIHTASGSSSSSTNAINTNITATDADGTFYPTFVSATSGYKPQLVDSGMTYNPSTNTLTVGTLIGATSGTVTNAVTSQNVVVALGSSNTDYFPTFVSATTGASLPILADTALKYNPFTDTLTVGTLIGTVSGNIATATTADNVKIGIGTVNTDYFPTFVTTSGSSLPEYIDPNLKYNPVQDVLSVSNLTVSGTLTATVGTAQVANGVIVTDNTSTATLQYPVFVSGVGGAAANIDSTGLTYLPSTNTLTATNFSGTATTATSATNIAVTDSPTYGDTVYPVFVGGASSSSAAKIDSTGMTYNAFNNTLTVANFAGTATNASNIGVLPTAAASNHYLTMVDGATGNKIPYTDGELTYNPSTNVMTVPNLTVSSTLTATVGSATNSTNAANVAITDYTSSTGSFYIPLTSSTSGNGVIGVDTSLQFSGTTNTVTIPNLTVSGTLTGTVSNAATATTATGLTVTTTSVDVDFNPIFVANSGSGVTPITDIDIKWNPSTNLLTVPNLTVSNTLTATVANATNATNVYVAPSSTAANFYPTFVSGNTAGNKPEYLDADLTYNPSTNLLTVPNLTVTGTLTATVSSTASTIVVTDNSTTNTNYLPLFTTAAGSSQAASVDTGFTYNPNTNTLTAGNITATGTLSGTFGGTIADATNAANVYVTPTNTAGIHYPTFVSSNTAGNKPEYLDTDLTYNPSTNTLTCPIVATTSITSSNTTLAVSKPIAPSYSYPVTSTSIGYIYKPTITWSQNFDAVIMSQALPAGVWILCFSISLTGTIINNFIYPQNSVVPNDVFFRIPFTNNGISGSSCVGTYVANMTSAGTVYLYNCVSNNQTLQVSECYIIRLA